MQSNSSGLFETGEQTKKCKVCKLTKPVTDFYVNYNAYRKPYYHSNCIPCNNIRWAAWKKSPNGKAQIRKAHLKVKFGLTPEQFAAMSAAQNHVCAICGKPETARKYNSKEIRNLSIDHNHDTGKVRALLCAGCNKGIGHFRDHPELLVAAIAYLQRHSDIS
jgi:hypothetical protein